MHDPVGQKPTALGISLNIVKMESTASIGAQVGARHDDSLKRVGWRRRSRASAT
jgi:hypothetical protein